jgi:hypothetical protein
MEPCYVIHGYGIIYNPHFRYVHITYFSEPMIVSLSSHLAGLIVGRLQDHHDWGIPCGWSDKSCMKREHPVRASILMDGYIFIVAVIA